MLNTKVNYKISCVSYLNSKTFIFGLENSELIKQGTIELSLDIPSRCAQKLVNNNVDIGLVPAAILPLINNYQIISKHCIGAKGKVDSVNLYSDVPLHQIKKIVLDYQSLTSINLTKVLCKNFWNINPEFENANENYITEINKNTAGVIIGDRTFNLKRNFNYVYDLAEQWHLFTGLPFVFAVWVSNKKIEKEFLMKFEKSLQNGIANIDLVSKMYQQQYEPYDVKKYLTYFIDYNFDNNKKNALNLFLDYLKKL